MTPPLVMLTELVRLRDTVYEQLDRTHKPHQQADMYLLAELQRAGDDPFLDEIGGELGFGRARRALCAGTSFVALGDGEQAEGEATTALRLFSEMPERVRWAAGELGARVDLAAARTLRGDLAGAEDALETVFALAPELRTEAVGRRLTSLGRVLGATRYRHAVEASRISEAIEGFTVCNRPWCIGEIS